MIVASLSDVRFTHGAGVRPALDGVSLDVRAGEILLVEGPSGSGKSTLIRVIAGLVPHFHGGRFEGRAEVLGQDTRRTSAAAIARGVGMVFQDPETQAVRSTVAADVAFGPENLAVASHEITTRVDDALRQARAGHLGDRDVTTLSGGERQRAAIAAALATRPRILLLDEPTSQLDRAAVAALDEILRDQAARGVAVVVTEHHDHRLSTIADRVVRLDGGRIVEQPAQMPTVPARIARGGSHLLEVRDISARFADRPVLRRCTFEVAQGTVMALHGDNGAGKSTLLRVLAGLHEAESGVVLVGGQDVTHQPTEARVPTIGFLPQDAGRRLIHEHVVDELVDVTRHLGRLEIDGRLRQVADELDLHGLLGRHPLDLSVGERERVALGAVLMANPTVILLDEPTRGMDVAHRAMLVAAIRRRSADGAAVLVATHDPRFADAVADVHLVMREGLVVHDEVAVHG